MFICLHNYNIRDPTNRLTNLYIWLSIDLDLDFTTDFCTTEILPKDLAFGMDFQISISGSIESVQICFVVFDQNPK